MQLPRRAWQWLFTPPRQPLTPITVIQWWELRRVPYNIVVGLASVVAMVAIQAWTPFFVRTDLRPSGRISFGLDTWMLFFNACYTLGWLLDAPKRFLDRKQPQCPGNTVTLFQAGLGVTLVLILGPPLLTGAAGVLRWLLAA